MQGNGEASYGEKPCSDTMKINMVSFLSYGYGQAMVGDCVYHSSCKMRESDSVCERDLRLKNNKRKLVQCKKLEIHCIALLEMSSLHRFDAYKALSTHWCHMDNTSFLLDHSIVLHCYWTTLPFLLFDWTTHLTIPFSFLSLILLCTFAHSKLAHINISTIRLRSREILSF